MALFLQAVRRSAVNVNVPRNPEEFIADEAKIEELTENAPPSIKLGQWKRVPIEEKGRKKVVMKIVEKELSNDEFRDYLKKEIPEFHTHVQRMKRQYKEIQSLKKNLQDAAVIIHMDFAENYACKSVEEIQSAYWTQTGVTLHPVVIYYRSESKQMEHKSTVIVSDEMGHNSATVVTFIDTIMQKVRELSPGAKTVHHWTDSPTSQYRNKLIFNLVANHADKYGVNAVWNYFEAGHGKGPCDGLGGTTKRMADEAVRSGKCVIQDASDFYAWTQSNACSMKNVHFLIVSASEVQRKAETLETVSIQPVKGTLKIHSVIGKGKDSIMVADVSCYCNGCISGAYCEGHWKDEIVSKKGKQRDVAVIKAAGTGERGANAETAMPTKTVEEVSSVSMRRAGNSDQNVFSPEEFVAAKYCNAWYVGKIIQIDEEDEDAEITFMQSTKGLYQWPKKEDKIWVPIKDIMCTVPPLAPTGKSKRMFKLYDKVKQQIEHSWKA